MASYFSQTKINKDKKTKVKDIKTNRSFLKEYDPNTNTLKQALSNVDESGLQLLNDIVTPLLSPIQTAKDLKALGSSVINLFKEGEQGNEDLARQVGQFFKDRYGGLENIKRTFATDPVGMLSDISIILTGGATLAPKASATANVLSKASKITSPIETALGTTVGKTASAAGEGVKQVSGVLTGTGVGALDTAIKTGRNYGTGSMAFIKEKLFGKKSIAKDKQKAFTDAKSGKISPENIATDFDKAVKEIKDAKNIDYRNALKELKLQDIKINPNEIVNKIDSYLDSQATKLTLADGVSTMNTGYTRFSKKTQAMVNTIKKELEIIKNNPNLHTAEVLHNLKFKIDDMFSKDASGGFAKTNIEISDIIDNKLSEVSNGYGSMNKAYSTAKKLEKKLIDELGAGNKKGATKTINQLLSVMKDQNLTNYGTRLETLKVLDNITESNIFEKIAGTQLSNFVPSGLVGRSAVGIGAAIPVAESLLSGSSIPISLPFAAAGVGLTSPKITGTVGNLAGKTQAVTKNLPFLNVLQRPVGNVQTLRGMGLLGVNRDDSIYQNQALQNRGLLR